MQCWVWTAGVKLEQNPAPVSPKHKSMVGASCACCLGPRSSVVCVSTSLLALLSVSASPCRSAAFLSCCNDSYMATQYEYLTKLLTEPKHVVCNVDLF